MMLALVTGTVAQFWAVVAGLKVSGAKALLPAGNLVLEMLNVDGAVQPAGTLLVTRVSVIDGCTVPLRTTAGPDPVVE